jgi:RNA polymerase primary sigma factor
MLAIDRYDPGKYCRLSTYATWWVRHYISRYVDQRLGTVRLPVNIRRLVQRIKKVSSHYECTHGKAPGTQELCVLLGIRHQRLLEVLALIRNCEAPDSLDRLEIYDDTAFIEKIADRTVVPVEDLIIEKSQKEYITMLIDGLKDRDAQIIKLRYGFENENAMTLKQVGKQINLSPERVRQIEERSIGLLKRLILSEEDAV